jgi:hypothetical protein
MDALALDPSTCHGQLTFLVLEAKIMCKTNKATQLAFRYTVVFFLLTLKIMSWAIIVYTIQLCIVITSRVFHGISLE